MTYSTEDFERIAEAVKVPVAKVAEERATFEAAATFYRLDKNAPKRTPPSVWNPKLESIHKNANRLLAALDIYEPKEAADGPPSELLDLLASHSERNEEPDILSASDRVGRLVEILNTLENAAEAARTLEKYSEKAIESVATVHKPLTTPGNKGDAAVNAWIDAAMTIYKRITQRQIGTSVGSPESKTAGQAGGPLIRFLTAAAAPLEIQHSPDAWRERIQRVVESAPTVD